MSNKYFNKIEKFALKSGEQVELQVNEVDMKPNDEFRLKANGYKVIKVSFINGIVIERAYVNRDKNKIYVDIKEIEKN